MTSPAEPASGELQQEILKIVWEHGDTTVREVHDALSIKRRIAYTTVMTVMARLAEQKLLRRRKSGASYVYRTAVPPEELAGKKVAALLARVPIGTPVLSHFVDTLDRVAPDKLEELAELIARKRRSKR